MCAFSTDCILGNLSLIDFGGKVSSFHFIRSRKSSFNWRIIIKRRRRVVLLFLWSASRQWGGSSVKQYLQFSLLSIFRLVTTPPVTFSCWKQSRLCWCCPAPISWWELILKLKLRYNQITKKTMAAQVWMSRSLLVRNCLVFGQIRKFDKTNNWVHSTWSGPSGERPRGWAHQAEETPKKINSL